MPRPRLVNGGTRKGRGKIRHAPWPNIPSEPGAHLYIPKEIKEYEEWVGICARTAGISIIEGPVGIYLEYRLRETRRGRSGDVDNYTKTVLDGLRGIAYEDDVQVVAAFCVKQRVQSPEDEGVFLQIGPISEASQVLLSYKAAEFLQQFR